MSDEKTNPPKLPRASRGTSAMKSPGKRAPKVPAPSVPIQKPAPRVVPPPRASARRDFDASLEALDPGVPLVLLPVRIETRFSASTLHVRVYPDEIFADAHEPELTDDERREGRAFHEAVARGDNPHKAWRALTLKFPSQRAAWIARATQPGASDPGSRDGSWTRAVMARLLPERWLVCAIRYQGTDGNGNPVAAWRAQREGAPIDRTLALTHAPPPRGAADEAPSEEELPFDDAMRWTVDYDRALAAGMAVDIPISSYDRERGIDRLFVVGVVGDLSPDESADALAHLFDAHHYTRGLALVPHGTCAHNTARGPAGFPPSEDPDETFLVECERATVTTESDGGRLSRALGLDPIVFEHVAGHSGTEQSDATAMNRVLWPATLGYFLTQLAYPDASAEAILETRAHFESFVRARGPLPTFRVGAVPYGVLPVSSLSRWVGRGDGVLEKFAVSKLRALRQSLRERLLRAHGLPAIPHAGRLPGDPYRDFVEILGTDAGTRTVGVRPVLGNATVGELARILGFHPEEVTSRLRAIQSSRASPWFATPGRVASLVFDVNAGRLRVPLVEASAPGEGVRASVYLDALRTMPAGTLRRGLDLTDAQAPMLYSLVRHAALLELLRIADEVTADPDGHMTEGERFRRGFHLDPEVVDGGADLPWGRFTRTFPGTADTFATKLRFDVTARADDTSTWGRVARDLARWGDALGQLSRLAPPTLEALLTECLDLCSYRVDAWETSLYTRRLHEMRTARPRGCHVGAWGFIERLGARPPNTRRSDGHVHAPSLDHAATAAVLLNAHLSGRGEDAERYRIDLSSARVRRALELLDAVRNGQRLGAVLGEQLERALQDGGFARHIAPLRQRFPVEAPEREQGGALESVAARDVTDGLRVDLALRDGFTVLVVPDDERTRVDAILEGLRQTVDALGDLLGAEAMFQMVRGNPVASGATLDAMGQGHRPPDPEVVRAPRGGLSVTHRVMLVLPTEGATPTGWRYEPTPRAALCPALDRWVGTLFGDPSEITCTAIWEQEERTYTETLTAAQFDLRPSDLLALAREAPPWHERGAESAFGTELERRLRLLLPPKAQKVVFNFGEGAEGFPRAFEVARALEDLIGGARALRHEDVVLPERAPTENRPSMTTSVGARVRDAVFSLGARGRALRAATTREALHDALLAASRFDLPGAIPEGLEEPLPALRQRALRIADEIRRRLYRAAWPASGDAAPPEGAPSETLDGQSLAAAQARADVAPAEVLEAVFGRKRVVLPDFPPLRCRGVGEVVPDIAAHPVKLHPSRDEVWTWLSKMWRVREPLSRWRTVSLYATALGQRPFLDIAQLEPRAWGRWVALPFEADAAGRCLMPPSDCVSLVRVQAQGDVSGDWTGLLLDAWTEMIPNAREQTGIAFHYDDPGAEAAQAVFVAVPPVPDTRWTREALLDTLEETFELAQIRALDPSELGELAQVLPAVYLAANAADATVSTTFKNALVADPRRPAEARR